MSVEFRKDRRMKMEIEKIYEKISAENLPNFVKYFNHRSRNISEPQEGKYEENCIYTHHKNC